MFLENTTSLCPECRNVIDAQLIRTNGSIYMHKKCSEHGEFKEKYWKDAELYEYIFRKMPKHEICHKPICVEYKTCHKHFDKSTTIMLHLTDRCDYFCPVCFANSNNKIFKEPTIEDIKKTLPDEVNGKEKPSVVLIGGEPTLRPDLPDIIKAIREKGYYPRLSTNGNSLTDREYLKRLKGAGLEWIILQFDGFSDEVYKTLRGKKLLGFKKELINLLDEFGFKVHLAIMAVNGINTDSAGEIVEFSLKKRAIVWVSFYPCTEIFRNELKVKDTYISDVIKSLDNTTGGMIKRSDFINMIRIMNILYKISKKEIFRTKTSTLPLIIVSDKKGFYPITRFLNPLFMLKKIFLAFKVMLSLRKIIKFQEDMPPENVLFLVIEKFHNYSNIDFKEASNCHMCYMVKDGFVAFDTFNALYREKNNW